MFRSDLKADSDEAEEEEFVPELVKQATSFVPAKSLDAEIELFAPHQMRNRSLTMTSNHRFMHMKKPLGVNARAAYNTIISEEGSRTVESLSVYEAARRSQ